jgi:hypothetical protein
MASRISSSDCIDYFDDGKDRRRLYIGYYGPRPDHTVKLPRSSYRIDPFAHELHALVGLGREQASIGPFDRTRPNTHELWQRDQKYSGATLIYEQGAALGRG